MNDFERYLEFQREIAEMTLKLIAKYQGKSSESSRFGQLAVVEEILEKVGRPLHINEIIKIAKDDYNTNLYRDSVSSAIAKKIKTGCNFIRTSPNTFFIKKFNDNQRFK